MVDLGDELSGPKVEEGPVLGGPNRLGAISGSPQLLFSDGKDDLITVGGFLTGKPDEANGILLVVARPGRSGPAG